MKKMKNSIVTVAAMLCCVVAGFNTQAAQTKNFGGVFDGPVVEAKTQPHLFNGLGGVVTNNVTVPVVTVYWYPTSGPYDMVTDTFLAWADDICKSFSRYGGLDTVTGSRSNNPAAVGFESNFEAGDLTIPDPTTTNTMWRFGFDPTNSAYMNQLGNLMRFSALIIPTRGQISLAGLSGAITETSGGTLDNVASYISSTYGRTAIGFVKGPSGVLFGPDSSFLETNQAGTNMVDGICITGIRCGFWANGQAGLNAINNYITTNGDRITCTYSYQSTTNVVTGTSTNTVVNIENHSRSVMLWPQGQIPQSCKGKEIFPAPLGEIFTLANVPEDQTWNVWVSRFINSPALNTNNPPYYSGATVGYSFVWPFIGGTNDVGFVRFEANAPAD